MVEIKKSKDFSFCGGGGAVGWWVCCNVQTTCPKNAPYGAVDQHYWLVLFNFQLGAITLWVSWLYKVGHGLSCEFCLKLRGLHIGFSFFLVLSYCMDCFWRIIKYIKLCLRFGSWNDPHLVVVLSLNWLGLHKTIENVISNYLKWLFQKKKKKRRKL